MTFKIKDIAEMCDVSVATVRNYEAWGLIPETPRTQANYRLYTTRHINYLKCVLAMRAGFSRPEIHTIIQACINEDVNQVLLLSASKQRSLVNALDQANQTMQLLHNSDLNGALHVSKPLSIHQASEYTHVPISTLRH